MAVQYRADQPRGCGLRKAGGLYLVAGGAFESCGRVPSPLSRCPTCDHGIKPARGFTWVDADALLKPCLFALAEDTCGLATISGRHGLLWVGEKFYPTPLDFLREAAGQGISRRIKAVPRDFVLGEHYVLLAHRHTMPGEKPGIFSAFKPTAIEYITRGDETPEEIEALEKRGITAVRVELDLPLAPAGGRELFEEGDDEIEEEESS